MNGLSAAGFKISGLNMFGDRTTGPKTVKPNIGANMYGDKIMGAKTEIWRFCLV